MREICSVIAVRSCNVILDPKLGWCKNRSELNQRSSSCLAVFVLCASRDLNPSFDVVGMDHLLQL